MVARRSIWLYGNEPYTSRLTWLGDERIAVGAVPSTASVVELPAHGVTHIVNCRARPQTMISRDLLVERALFGRSRVVAAPMWDHGRAQPPRLWSGAARFAARALDDDPEARVLIHCHQGRRRSVLVAYAVLRLRGLAPEDAARVILDHRREAELVPAYQTSVELWLSGTASPR
jgi:protein-tyrosine phosphatase